MKTGITTKLALTALILIVSIADANSQFSFTAGSSAKSAEAFIFKGTVEGVVTDIATISFDVLAEGTAELLVTNDRGEVICELVNGEVYPGSYTVYYKPGEDISAGMYLLRFAMNGESRVERFIVSK